MDNILHTWEVEVHLKIIQSRCDVKCGKTDWKDDPDEGLVQARNSRKKKISLKVVEEKATEPVNNIEIPGMIV